MVQEVTALSLKGTVVAITRPLGQTKEMASLVSKFGGTPYVAPTVEIKPTRDLTPVREFVKKTITGQIDIIIFTSQNGVVGLVNASQKLKLKSDLLAALNSSTIVAIGPRTKEKLQSYGIRVELTPLTFTSKGIAKSLSKQVSGKIVALPRIKEAKDYLSNELKKASATVLEVPVYESILPRDKSKVHMLMDDILCGKINVITFTSSGTALNLFKIADEQHLRRRLQGCLNADVTVVAIGPETRKTLMEMGVKVDVVPLKYTTEAMVEALVRHLNTDLNRSKLRSN